MLKFLLSQFLKKNGRNPNNLEMILLKQKAAKEAIDQRKIVSMSDRSPVDPNKPILGGRNIEETEDQIKQRIINQNKESIERLKNKKNPEEFAYGGVAGLLGERTGFAGGGMGRRGFLKLLAGAGAGIGALKSGIFGLGKKTAVKKVAKELATPGGPPPYFFKLVEKITKLGDDAPRLAVKDREKVTTFKEYQLTEDVTTGEQTIQRMKVTDPESASYYGQPLTEETYMSYKPGKGQADEMTKGKTIPDEYEEGTAHLRSDGMNAGEVVEESAGISDEIFEEVGEVVPEVIRKGKSGGGIMKIIKKLKNKLKIKQSGNSVKDFVEKRKFLESLVGNTEKNKKARELKMLKEAMEEARENPGFKFKDIDVDKEIKPIFDQSKDRTLNAGGGIITKLIKKLNAISPGSTKRGKLSKPMSKRAKDKKELREAVENFSKRNRGR